MLRIARYILLVFCACCLPAALRAQTVTAKSCAQSDVLTALNSVNAATATVNIPSGTCQWTSTLTYNVPSNNTGLTIQGQTTCTGSGDPAQNNLACSDGTIIVDNTSANSFWNLTTNSSPSSVFRITGITFAGGSNTGGQNYASKLVIGGQSQNVRVDHVHFNQDSYTGASWIGSQMGVHDCTYGVIDHNRFDESRSTSTNTIIFDNGVNCAGDTQGWGAPVWAAPTGFGTNQFMYVEQNYFNMALGSAGLGMMNDCIYGGKWAWRFNTGLNGHLQTHPTGSLQNTFRGCRAEELYQNKHTTSGGGAGAINTYFFHSSGPAMVWGNSLPTATGVYNSLDNIHNCRTNSSDSCGYAPAAPPNGWGFCGSVSGAGGPSAWDGNSNSSGYPCLDQPGRGQSDLLTGNFPDACDSILGCLTFVGTWPNQKLEPNYYWLNAANSGTVIVGPTSPSGDVFAANRDYYVSSDSNSGTDCNGFTGATGVGCGTLANRPSTCTAGPGGTWGASPTGSYGVAYWATDQGNWNTSGNGTGQGELFVCTATNTWTLVYTPYGYPHPLTSGQTVQSPAAPTNLSATVD